MWKYIVVICSHLSCLFNFLLYRSFFKHSHDHYFGFPSEQTTEPSLSTVQYNPKPSGTSDQGPVECAVCLCRIEEGDEVIELRCDHLFHKQCLDRWTGFNRATCPLCRSVLAPPIPTSTLVSHSQQFVQSEVLLFKFCSLSSDSDDGDRWWLR